MARITFTDDVGSATLDNGLTAIAGGVAGRFRGWTPEDMPIGPARHALGTGARHVFRFRRDYGARFALAEIPLTHLPVALRLKSHLLNGGTVRVDTEDSFDRSYATCGLWPETMPTIELTDARAMTYTLSLALLNLAASPEPMLCEYVPLATPGAVLLLATPDRLDGVTFARATTATYTGVG